MGRWLHCPFCHGVVDGVLNPSGRLEPRDWQPAICPHCYQVVVFDSGRPGGLRPPDEEDFAAWALEPSIMNGLHRSLAATETQKDHLHDPRP